MFKALWQYHGSPSKNKTEQKTTRNWKHPNNGEMVKNTVVCLLECGTILEPLKL